MCLKVGIVIPAPRQARWAKALLAFQTAVKAAI